MPVGFRTILTTAVTMVLLNACAPAPEAGASSTKTAGSNLDGWRQIEHALEDGAKSQPQPHAQPQSLPSAPPIASLVERLQERIAAEPENLGHRTLLVQTYAFLGDKQAAEQALSDAVTLGADEKTLRSQLHAALRGTGAAQSW